MEGVATAEAHRQVTILVRQVGVRSPAVLNRLLERLNRQSVMQVSDNPHRLFFANFATHVLSQLTKFGELQTHRKVFGLIGFACSPHSTQPSTSATTTAPAAVNSRRHSTMEALTIEDVAKVFNKEKEDMSSTLVDSRCILFGYSEDEVSQHFNQRDVMCFSRFEDADGLESFVRDFLRGIYFILESRRIDVSFEKQEFPSCPSLPEEEKFRIGLENKTSKAYRRKCVGRWRKQHADLALLTGLPQLAVEAYQASIDALKPLNDQLWLAAACEGCACAMTMMRHDTTSSKGVHRVASMTPANMTEAREQAEQQFLFGAKSGHQRQRSDASSLPAVENGVAATKNADADNKRSSLLNWSRNKKDKNTDYLAIFEKFQLALDHYNKFSFAAHIEYECMMSTVTLLRLEKRLIDMESFHREHVGKYLDDSFTTFDHATKSILCSNSAELYKTVGFRRKGAFFDRLGVLFRLHIEEGAQRTAADYRIVYPILYRTLAGYGVTDSGSSGHVARKMGPTSLQIKALHEVYTAAVRAELPDAAIRHACCMIQNYYDDMEPVLVNRLFDDLRSTVALRPTPPQLNQRLPLEIANIVLPSMQMTRFPSVKDASLCALAPHLAPTVKSANDNKPDIFIYSPFQVKKPSKSVWVVDCACEVGMTVRNVRSVELVVKDLCLLAEGCQFESVPVKLLLPSADNANSVLPIKLIGFPRLPGRIRITGYSCEVFGVKNICRLPITNGKLEVDVLPSLALLTLECSLPRAPIHTDDQPASCEMTIYSGQVFEHMLVATNQNSTPIRIARLQVWQPKVSGGPSLIEVMSEDGQVDSRRGLSSFKVEAKGSKSISFKIFGIDPTTTTDDATIEEKVPETALPLTERSSAATLDESAHDLIPYTGRLLTCQFSVVYESDIDGPNGEVYERTATLALAVSIVPAVTVSAWHVLPGDSAFTRYIVVDVTNSTDDDAELIYSGERRMNVLPKETCRVPLLCPCCTDVAARAFYLSTLKDGHMAHRANVDRLRRKLEDHVAKHLDIRWTVPTMNIGGLVPVGALLASVSLLKQLVLPEITLDTSINGNPYLSEDDISVGIGELIRLDVTVISSMDVEFNGVLSLECYQELSNQLGTIDRQQHLLVIGASRIPFVISARGDDAPSKCTVQFNVMFRVEGVYKLRPLVATLSESDKGLFSEMFVCPVGFNVATKSR